MKPKDTYSDTNGEFKENEKTELDKRREMFPSLALPNNDKVRVSIYYFLPVLIVKICMCECNIHFFLYIHPKFSL